MITGILSDQLLLSADEFEGNVQRAMNEFLAMGCKDGDTIALLLRNDLAFLTAVIALGRLGIYAATLNWHAHHDEVRYILEDCGALAVIVEADFLDRLIPGIPEFLPIYFAGRGDGAGLTSAVNTTSKRIIHNWHIAIAAREPVAAARGGLRGVIVYTSGTTGRPKGVQRKPFADNAGAEAQAAQLASVFGTRKAMRTIVCAPLYHGAPCYYARLAIRDLAHSGLVVVHTRFDPEHLLRDVQEYGITHLWLVPTMFHRLLSLPESVRRSYDTSSLEWVIHGAAPCPPAVKSAMLDWLGPIVYEFYGATETGPLTLASPQEAMAKPGTVGRPLPKIRITIRDEAGAALPIGQVGEICSKNPSYPDFTYINRESERRIMDVADELRTGDVGEIDTDGYLFLRDRKKDMIIVGGVNVYPAEIEAVLLAMPGIADCAVFGLPDAEYGEIIAAAVMLHGNPGIGEDDIRSFLRERQAIYKIPRRIEFLSELPREDTGKIFKRKLRENMLAKPSRAEQGN